MRIIINDANILMDLADLNLLLNSPQLRYELHTTDFVIAEIEDNDQSSKLNSFIKDKILKVISFSSERLNEIYTLANRHSGLSITDCSVLSYSKEVDGILLTGDGKLRKVAQKADIEVRGILFIFDELVDKEVISKETAVIKLNELMTINSRLPVDEINKRVEKWKNK